MPKRDNNANLLVGKVWETLLLKIQRCHPLYIKNGPSIGRNAAIFENIKQPAIRVIVLTFIPQRCLILMKTIKPATFYDEKLLLHPITEYN